MTEAVEKLNYKGVEIEIFRDEEPVCPREWAHIGTMVCWHSRHKLGDEQPRISPKEWRQLLALETVPKLEDELHYWRKGKGYARTRLELHVRNPHMSVDELKQEVLRRVEERINLEVEKVLERHYVLLPLYLYDHSGLTMNTSGFGCPWDSGQVGYIYCTKAEARKQVGGGLKKIEAALRAEVQEYSYWLEGSVYGWSFGDESCWNYYGTDHEESGLLADAQAAVDNYLDSLRTAEQEWHVKWEIDVLAASPEEAAQRAREAQLRPDSLALTYEVAVGGMQPFVVNLQSDTPWAVK